jgi:hypothetical protein
MKLTSKRKIVLLLISPLICMLGYYVGLTHSNSLPIRLLDSLRPTYLVYCLTGVILAGLVALFVKFMQKK